MNPIHFRPSAKDADILEKIASDHPVFAGSPAELVRLALGAYLASRTRSDRVERMIEALCTKLGVQKEAQ
jgi:hypothetical protein